MKKCSKGNFCKSLEKRLQEPNAHKKGFVPVAILINVENIEEKCLGVAYKESANDKGVFINYCPWCGENVAPQEESEITK